jgi:hypothetical protein
MSTATPSADRQWYIVGRWQEFEGEARANLLRIVGIAAFYSIELLNYHGLRLGFLHMPRAENISREFHVAVTYLAVAWTMVGLGVLLCLRRQIFPAALKFVSTGCDLVLLTAILMLADGPRSPLVVAYFLVIALATLRFNLPLVRFAAVGAMVGYLILLGYDKWFRVPRPETLVPRYHQLIVLLALGLTGVLLGQVVRRVQNVAREYARRMEKTV